MLNEIRPDGACLGKHFAWALKSPTLTTLAYPTLRDVFTASVSTLNTFFEVDRVLEAIEAELGCRNHSATAIEELKLLRERAAWRGCQIAVAAMRREAFDWMRGDTSVKFGTSEDLTLQQSKKFSLLHERYSQDSR